MKLWDWFNGKKTTIGAVLQVASDVAPVVLSALPAVGVPLAAALAISAKTMLVLGLAHKVLKFLA